MTRKASQIATLGLLSEEEAKAEAKPREETLFQRADAYLASLGYPSDVVREFNLFLGHYCKRRGKPDMELVKGWVEVLERNRQWKYDFEDVAYVLRWSRTTDKYYVAIPPEMGNGGSYWAEKEKAVQSGVKSRKVYV